MQYIDIDGAIVGRLKDEIGMIFDEVAVIDQAMLDLVGELWSAVQAVITSVAACIGLTDE